MEQSEFLTLMMQLGWAIASVFDPKELISYQNLFVPLLIVIVLGYVAFRRGESLKEFLFPGKLRAAKSVRMDILYYLVIIPLGAFILIPAVTLIHIMMSHELIGLADSLFGIQVVQGENSVWEIVLYSALIFLCLDFGFYISHYFQHKCRFLWCFHKVHHSPTQLVIFTSARFHPVDILWNVGVALLLISLASSLAQLTFYSGDRYYMLWGNHVLIAISYLTTHNLRHSHIWLHYPKWLRGLMSPAQHQIHHSVELRHRDTNMGYLLTCWDRWFGTLYEPKGKEIFRLGVEDVPESDAAAHDSLWKMLWLPCKEAYHLARNKRQQKTP